jgi:glutamate dehydrogenase/leucine dehydrogenase
MTHAKNKRRGHGEDSIYRDESRNRYIGAVDLGFSPAGIVGCIAETTRCIRRVFSTVVTGHPVGRVERQDK